MKTAAVSTCSSIYLQWECSWKEGQKALNMFGGEEISPFSPWLLLLMDVHCFSLFSHHLFLKLTLKRVQGKL
jgi:hypothetical protein